MGGLRVTTGATGPASGGVVVTGPASGAEEVVTSPAPASGWLSAAIPPPEPSFALPPHAASVSAHATATPRPWTMCSPVEPPTMPRVCPRFPCRQPCERAPTRAKRAAAGELAPGGEGGARPAGGRPLGSRVGSDAARLQDGVALGGRHEREVDGPPSRGPAVELD